MSASELELPRGKALALLRNSHALRRPVLTHCLEECGYDQQACVTACEVCVERHRCKHIKRCDVCLEETQQMHRVAEKMDKNVIDSGGAPIVHFDLKQKLYAAELDFAEERRQLQTARDQVLMAQREAEWGTQESGAYEGRLKLAKVNLAEAKKRLLKYTRTHEKELAKSKHWKKLLKSKRELRQAQQELAAARKDLRAQQTKQQQDKDRKARVNETEVQTGSDAAHNKEWELQRKVEKLKQEVNREESKLAKKKRDAGWVHRELAEDVIKARKQVVDIQRRMDQSGQMEEMTQYKLKKAQERYLEAREKRAKYEKHIVELRAKLSKHPMYPDGATPRPPMTPSPLLGVAAWPCRAGGFFTALLVATTFVW